MHRCIPLEPAYPSDTLTAVSTTEAMRESASTEGRGVVTWHNEGLNQHGRKVIEFRRSNLDSLSAIYVYSQVAYSEIARRINMLYFKSHALSV